ncbi:MAG: Mrp/NBP35 family ATP-binding protein [Chloroflexi bacterium]|nr:Mrp/NBP35 family ATP-binding protein [Chloroflexota bacterium]
MMQHAFSRVRTTARYILMMISAKGGVGKSTLTVNLAGALAARGVSVGVFDADLHGPNIPALLGLTQKRALDPLHPEAMLPIEARVDSMDSRPLAPYQRYGINIMSLGLVVGPTQAINLKPETAGPVMASLLNRIDWGGIDVLLLDMPPGTGEPLQTILDQGLADGALVVTTRERLAHLDNGRLITLLRSRRLPVLGIVENMTHVICPHCGELIELYPAPTADSEVYGSAEVLASVPFHHSLIRPRRGGPPLALARPDDPAAESLLRLADAIRTHIAAAPRRIEPNGAGDSSDAEECADCP